MNRHERRRLAAKNLPIGLAVDIEATRRLERAKAEGREGRALTSPSTDAITNPVGFTIRSRVGHVFLEFDRPIITLGLTPRKARKLAETFFSAADAAEATRDALRESQDETTSGSGRDKS